MAGNEPRVVVLSVVEVPPDQPLTSGLDMARSYRALLEFLPGYIEVGSRRVRVDRSVKVARDVPSAVRQAAHDEQASMVLFYWKGYTRDARRYAYGHTLDAVLKDPPCTVVLLRPEGRENSRRVLLPVRGGPSAERALSIALLLAEHASLPLTVMHNVPAPDRGGGSPTDIHTPDAHDAMGTSGDAPRHASALGEAPYIIFTEHLKKAVRNATVRVDTVLTVGQDPVPELLKEMHPDDLVVMGLAAPSTRHQQQQTTTTAAGDAADTASTPAETAPAATMPVPLAVTREKGPPVLLVRSPEPVDLARYAHEMRAGRTRRSGKDMPFEQWFVEHTFHGGEFHDPGELLAAKRASGLTISVALLTSNDAGRMHSIITGLKRVLVEMYPIADQIAVIDAGSTDGTTSIARSPGVEVYSVDEILPEQGRLHGRGESWWKSLAVLRGDILVWLDPRARRFHPSAALALAGPLLRLPGLQLVKAFGRSVHDEVGTRRGAKRKPLIKADADANGRGNGDDSGLTPMPAQDGGLYVDWGGVSWELWESWERRAGGTGMPGGRLRVQALKPADLKALTPEQIALLPPQTILQVLYPSLAGVIAPFGRDMAGRRRAMMSVPALIGENLEVGVLLSIASLYGVRAIAQVELSHARPAPPPPPGLHSAMDLLQVLALRLQDPTMRRYAQDVALALQKEIEGRGTTDMGHAHPENENAEILEVRALGPVERPPMRDVLERAGDHPLSL
jgi:nucleotide-binding universal stress UspA family protein